MDPTYPGLPSRRTEMEEAIFAAHDALSHREAGAWVSRAAGSEMTEKGWNR